MHTLTELNGAILIRPLTFEEWLERKLSEPMPRHLPSARKYVEEIHDRASRACSGEDFGKDFPYMDLLKTADWQRIEWWMIAFRRWHKALSLEDYMRFSQSPVAV